MKSGNVLVAGAHGLTGHQIINKLSDTTFTPIAGVRKDAQRQAFEDEGVASRLIDVRRKVSDLAKQMANIDALVITVAGNALINLDGKVKLVQAAKKVGLSRIILISAIEINHFHDDTRQDWMDMMEEYAAEMYYADMYVINSGTDFTSIRPGTLTNDSETKRVTAGQGLPNDQIARADVANAVVESLYNDHSIGKAFDLIAGETPVDQAIRGLK